MSVGKEIVKKSKSPFVDDDTIARWIDFAIEQEAVDARRREQIRIETIIAQMGQDELLKAQKLCESMHGTKP